MNNSLLSKVSLLIVALAVAISSCTSNLDAPEHADAANYIRFASVPVSRALIEDEARLQAECSTGGKAIGIWSAYELEGQIVKNVLGNNTGDVSLIYVPDTEWDNHQWWTYGDPATLWQIGAKYTFNAYFPKNVVNEISSSDVSTFVIEYNTERYQDDLMTAYSYIDTTDPTFRMGEPVALNLLHTLAAVRFQFSFIDSDGTTFDDSDALTYLALENSAAGRGIASTGVLAFGTKLDDGTLDGEHIHWYAEDYPINRKFYEWSDPDGVIFVSTPSSRKAAVAYSTNADGKQKFAINNGWILTIPQQIDGSAQICFKLASTGDLVHHIPLPAAEFEPGKRYTYDIRFGRTSMDIKLGIADWNERKSTQDIPL
ncbi:MAG: fimbrillin family protein [Bacteroidales bacterium]|nr:fimbrillin family protein [Bacteroidales bacterium]